MGSKLQQQQIDIPPPPHHHHTPFLSFFLPAFIKSYFLHFILVHFLFVHFLCGYEESDILVLVLEAIRFQCCSRVGRADTDINFLSAKRARAIKGFPFSAWLGHSIALHASATARTSTFLTSACPVHSSSLFLDLLSV